MKVQLIKLKDRNILVSDEPIKEYEWVYHEKYGAFIFEQLEQGNIIHQCKKIIAGVDKLPEIDYSELSTEDLDRLGIEVQYDYDAVGKMKMNDALKAFKIKHGYDLSTKEDRSNGDEYLEYNSYGIVGDKVSLLYFEQPMVGPSSSQFVEFEVPLIDESYPKIFRRKEFDDNRFTLQDMVEIVQSMNGAPSTISDESAKGIVERFINRKRTFDVEIEVENFYDDDNNMEIVELPAIKNNSIKLLKVL